MPSAMDVTPKEEMEGLGLREETIEASKVSPEDIAREREAMGLNPDGAKEESVEQGTDRLAA